MAQKTAVTTLGQAGIRNINLGATSTPYAVSIVVQNKTATAESTKHVSIGSATTSGQRVTSYIKEPPNSSTTYDDLTKIISQYEWVSGAPVEVLSASFNGFTSNGVSLNVTQTNTNYDVYIRVDY